MQNLWVKNQKTDEDKKQFFPQMNDNFGCLGDTFYPEQFINMYIDGSKPANNSLVQEYCNTHEGCSYMDMVK